MEHNTALPKNHAIAAKVLLVHNNSALILKRRTTDAHDAGAWDLPGGRLDSGEAPARGAVREVHEETSIILATSPEIPIGIHYFTRDDGQQITMIVYLLECAEQYPVTLSEEHTDYQWLPLDTAAHTLRNVYTGDIERAKKYL